MMGTVLSHLSCNNDSPHREDNNSYCMCALQSVCLSVLLDSFTAITAVATIKICVLLLGQFVHNVIFCNWGSLRIIHDNMKKFLATTLNRLSSVC